MDTASQAIAVIDFGGQYAHLIANRIRRLGVYSDIIPSDAQTNALKAYKGFILSGGPSSVYDTNAPAFNKEILNLGKPLLGLCYGHQLIAATLGGTVVPGSTREYGKAQLRALGQSPVFKGLEPIQTVWMSHGDTVTTLPEGFVRIASTDHCDQAAVEHPGKRIFGFQFHPEVTHTTNGMAMLANFLDICGCGRLWNMKNYLRNAGERIKEKVGDRNVFLLVSGGVDSTVAFALLNRALGEKRVQGLHINNGLMRKDETRGVEEYLKKHNFNNLKIVDATHDFLDKLKDVYDPEKKRRIIGDTFIEVQRRELLNLDLDPEQCMLGQGTIYPDTIESGGTKNAALIKTHHNRVPIIEQMIREGKVIEPLADLYKDEVRELGEELGLAHALVWRHPFPGPGLGVRLLCSSETIPEISKHDRENLDRLASARGFTAETLPIKSVGVQGDFRTYALPVALKGSYDWDAIEAVSTDITNNVKSVNRVVLGLASKAGTIAHVAHAYTTPQRLSVLREADAVVTAFLQEKKLYDQIWQMPVVLIPVSSNTEEESIVLRPVSSSEAMTASFFRIPFDLLSELTSRIMAIPGVSAVYYDVTHKPPGTIEWE